MTGAVYDRGYRPYEGPRGERAASRLALYRATIRRALGLRRSWRQKVAPFSLLAVVTIPAVVNVGAKYLTRNTPAQDIDFITYRDYVGVSNALLVFVAVTAPDIMCPDRRQRVLPLIFARPLTGRDYVLAKVGAMASILFAFSFLPQVVLFVGQMLVSSDGALSYARDNAEVIWQVPVAVGLLALFHAAIGVALSSLTGRRIIAGASIVGFFLVTSIVSGVMVGEDWDDSDSAVISSECMPAGSPFDTEPRPVPESCLRDLFGEDADPKPAALLDTLGLPLVLRDVVFLGHVHPAHPLSGFDNGALYAFATYTVIVCGALGLLVHRYDQVER